MEFQFVPLSRWPIKPTADHARKRAKFNSTWSQTMDLLERELKMLRAKSIVLQMDCDAKELRRDGLPRADARVKGPGIVLSFESPKGALSFPCDQYKDWQDNVRAIALSLEALRAVDRHGVTRNAEQYRGWTALPDKTAAPEFADRSAAINWLVKAGAINALVSDNREIRRQAIAKFHPDRCGGDDAQWKVWLSAAKALGIEV